jgi:4-alpha-methyl-delta7-sterol-4alpha-methyl oxidase
LHTPWLFRHVHSVHHRIRTPFALAGLYFHWAEYAAIGTLVLVGPLIVGAHVFTIWVWVVLRQLEAAEGHGGYDFPLSPLKLLPGYDGNGYHDYHHGSFVGNFAGAFGYLDRWFGTRSPGYVEYVEKAAPVR